MECRALLAHAHLASPGLDPDDLRCGQFPMLLTAILMLMLLGFASAHVVGVALVLAPPVLMTEI